MLRTPQTAPSRHPHPALPVVAQIWAPADTRQQPHVPFGYLLGFRVTTGTDIVWLALSDVREDVTNRTTVELQDTSSASIVPGR
jgi:hypothetical protein